MRKYGYILLLYCISLALVLMLCGCDGNIQPTPKTEQTEQVTPELKEPTPGSVDETATTGVIASDVFYKDVAVSLLLSKPFASILGDPLDEEGPYFFYNGLEIYSLDGQMAEQVQITNPSLVKINGVALDMTRTELIAMFGKPEAVNTPNDYPWISYHIQGSEIDYTLVFWFTNPDNEEGIYIIQILL